MSALAESPRPAPDPGALPRLLAGVRHDSGLVSLERHVERHGSLPQLRSGRAPELIELVEESGLRGRGGAGFPTGRKLRAVAEAGRRPIVVANGMEGEPLSGKDRVLLAFLPHLVLDGTAAACAAVGARKAIVCVRADAPDELAALGAALAERRKRGVDHVALELVTGGEGFIAGEETALVSWLSGGPGSPTLVPPRPFERGVRGAPTLVQNVETLANVALIARFGPAWFRGLGTEEEPGTALVSLGGAVCRPGVYEIPLGLLLGDLLAGAGGPSQPLSAFLIGGYYGAWVESEAALRLRLCDSDLSTAGAALGARAVYALPAGACGVLETARVARYLATESAGQCGPCVHGLDAIADGLAVLARGEQGGARELERVVRWVRQVRGRGACRHPDGAARFVATALTVFAEELDEHAHGRCGGGPPWLPVDPRARRGVRK